MNWIDELRYDVDQIKLNGKEFKKFGLLIGGIFCVVSFFAIWKDWWSEIISYVITAAGIFLICAGLIIPNILRGIYKYWMMIAIVIGSVVAKIILIVVFYCIVSPVGILSRSFRKKFFVSFRSKDLQSYWIKKEKVTNYEQMW